MPYIKPHKRIKIEQQVRELVTHTNTSGEMNYAITRLIHQLMLNHKPLSYDMLNSMIGVLECAKLELYRMVAAPYENKKRFDNGCISELDTVDGKSY